jgi:hypothetical protein
MFLNKLETNVDIGGKSHARKLATEAAIEVFSSILSTSRDGGDWGRDPFIVKVIRAV